MSEKTMDDLLIAIADEDLLKAAEIAIILGASPDAHDYYNKTALMYTTDHSNFDLTRLLLQKGANVKAMNDNKENALAYLMKQNKTFKLLKAHGDKIIAR